MIRSGFERTLIIAAGCLVAFASPAGATNTASNNTAAPAPQAQQRDNNANSERQICVREALSGSHVVRRICKTAREWQAAGGLPTDDSE